MNIEILNYNFLENSVLDYLIAVGVFFLALAVLKIFKFTVLMKLKKIAKQTSVEFDDILIESIDAIGWPLYSFLSIYIAIQFIQFPNIIGKIISVVILVILTYYIVKAIQQLIDFGFGKVIEKKQKEENFDPAIINLSKRLLKGVLWIFAVIIILQNLGYNVSTLIAGLGIGGLAIAIALQNILADIFSAFCIYFDKPFQIGDFIKIGEDMGKVKQVGIKSTRIETLQGEELIISNRELTGTRVHNFKKMEKRRIVFNFGITYETPTEKVKKVPELVKDIFNMVDGADLDRVHFKTFGDSDLNFEIVYFLSSSEYNDYMDIQQEINLSIKDAFEKEGIHFAYPTKRVFVEK
ncbi:mechanosensitive ion channel family protein [Patescibacteria group bacterium]|nr:mechanosensitive ion channel family protein [Patescibacteria group bacterium]